MSLMPSQIRCSLNASRVSSSSDDFGSEFDAVLVKTQAGPLRRRDDGLALILVGWPDPSPFSYSDSCERLMSSNCTDQSRSFGLAELRTPYIFTHEIEQLFPCIELPAH